MKTKILLSLSLVMMLAAACHPDEDEPTPIDNGNTHYVSSDINTHTTWYSDTVYVIDTYDFYVKASLTIQAGTIIKFQAGTAPYMGLAAGGTIIANGTAAHPIIFTSYLDDIHGGDTNGDGTVSAPAAGDWDCINVNAVNSNVFNYCEFYYGGNGSYHHTLSLYGSSNNTVSNCIFAHNKGGKFGDFYYGALDASDAEDGTVITNNVFYDNILPLSVSMSFDLDASNTFHDPNNPARTNTMNGIFTYAISEIIDDLFWAETEVAYVIHDNDLWIESQASLNLANNVVIKFTFDSELLKDGTINQGTGVFFTSFKDDLRKGDTNGDGTATTPANGDWNGIYDNSGNTPDPYFFTWANILYDTY